jgi:hypothetical protein
MAFYVSRFRVDLNPKECVFSNSLEPEIVSGIVAEKGRFQQPP